MRRTPISICSLFAVLALLSCGTSQSEANDSGLEERVAELEAQLSEAVANTAPATTTSPSTTTTPPPETLSPIVAWGDSYHGLTSAFALDTVVDAVSFYWQLQFDGFLFEPDLVVHVCRVDLEDLAQPARDSQEALLREYPSELLDSMRPGLTSSDLTLGDQLYLSPGTAPSPEFRAAFGTVIDSYVALLADCIDLFSHSDDDIANLVSAVRNLELVASEAGLPGISSSASALVEPVVRPGMDQPTTTTVVASPVRVSELDLSSALDVASAELIGRNAPAGALPSFIDHHRRAEDEAFDSGYFPPSPVVSAKYFLRENYGEDVDEFALLQYALILQCIAEGRSGC